MVLPSTHLKLPISIHLQSDPHLIQITRKDNILSEENISYQLLIKCWNMVKIRRTSYIGILHHFSQ